MKIISFSHPSPISRVVGLGRDHDPSFTFFGRWMETWFEKTQTTDDDNTGRQCQARCIRCDGEREE